MLFKNLLYRSSILLPAFTGQGQAAPAASQLEKRATLEEYIAAQEKISYAGVLANIGADGAKGHGASAGLVLASPSKQAPDYFYTWTRDAALVYKALFEQFSESGEPNLRLLIQDYITAQAKLQTVTNPSGALWNGAGLGEAKFIADGTQFTGEWGRPQRDGPPLRAITLSLFGNWLVDNGQSSLAINSIWPTLQNDLAYTAQYWNETGFDLWEEVPGSSFFATAVQYRALVQGSAFAKKIGKSCPGCDSQAPNILCFLQTYWNDGGKYVVSNINTGTRRTGKDIASVLASVNLFDATVGCDDVIFQPCSPRALANHKAVTDSFRGIYSLNNGVPQGKGVAVGRYSEDVYYNGNPWYLATLAAAEQLFFAEEQFKRAGSIIVTSTSLPFWRDLVPSIQTGTYASGSSTFTSLLSAMRTYADSYIAVAQKYTPAGGNLAEQFDKNTGRPDSAADLTWSYASILTVTQPRRGIFPEGWLGKAPSAPQGSCQRGGVAGQYTTAPTPSWPAFSCSNKATVAVTFNVLTQTNVGEDIYLVGSTAQLGSWDTSKAIKLNPDRYVDRAPLWAGTLNLAAGTKVEYKYLRKSGGVVTWESTANRLVTVNTGCRAAQGLWDQWNR